MFLVPCAFATGAEVDVVRAMPEADRVFGPGDYWRVALGWRGLSGPTGAARPAPPLLYLGGDLVHAAVLARRLRVPAAGLRGAGQPLERGRSGKCSYPTRGPGAAYCGRGEAEERVTWSAT